MLKRALITLAVSALALTQGTAYAQQKKPAAAAQPKIGSKTLEAQKAAAAAKSTPAAYTADDDMVIDAAADAKRDQQIEQLKKIIPKVSGPQKADLLFQLAELWWQKSKYRTQLGFKNWTKAVDEWEKKKDRGEDPGPQPQLEKYTREGELYRQEALRKYDEILKEYPTYERKDEVLFAFAFNKYEIGQKEDAIAKYNELIKQYPTSRFVPDAYVQMGEHYFNSNQLDKARIAYDRALNSPNNGKIKYFALYKLAWCDLNSESEDGYKAAVAKFQEVVANSSDKSGMGLKGEALRDLVQAYVYLDVPDDAIAYYKRNAPKELGRRLIATMGGKFQDAGKHESAIKVYRILIEDEPDDPRCPEYQNAIVTSYEGLRRRDMVAKEMRRLVETYRPSSPWAKANSTNKVALEIAYEITESAMRVMVTEYHQEAQRTKAVETFRLARDIYREYLDNFSDSEHAYNLRFFYAEILWALNEFEPAAEQYTKVVDKDPKGQYSKLAAQTAVLAWEKVVEIFKGQLKVQEIKDGGKVDDRKAKGTVDKTRVKLERRAGDVKEEEIPTPEVKLVEAIDRFVTLYPNSDDEIMFRYKAAFVFYDYKHDLEAARRFGAIIAKWPTDQYSRRAADFSLDILNKKGEWLELNKLAREFAANKKLIGNDTEFGASLNDIVESSQFMYIQEVVLKEDKPLAAKKFEELAAEFPRSKYATPALLYAQDIYGGANKFDEAIRVGEQLLKSYPDGLDIKGKAAKPRVKRLLGLYYEKTADFKKAAANYEEYSKLCLGIEMPTEGASTPAKKAPKKAPSAPKGKQPAATTSAAGEMTADEGCKEYAAAALYNAALWNEGLGNFDKAIELDKLYVDKFRGNPDAPTVYLNIGKLYEKSKNLSEALVYYRGFAGDIGSKAPAQMAFEAQYREMLALRDLKQDKEMAAKADELIKRFDRLSPKEKEVDTVRNAYSHARFLALEPMWANYVAVRINSVSQLKKLFQAKRETNDKVKQAYTEVIATGSPEWAIASLTRIGQAAQDFARNIVDSPDPRGLDEDQLQMYRAQLESAVFPLEDQAIAAFEEALKNSTKYLVYNEWSLLAQDQINKFKPGSFLERREAAYQGSEHFAMAKPILSLDEAAEPKVAAAPQGAAAAPAAQPSATSDEPASDERSEEGSGERD